MTRLHALKNAGLEELAASCSREGTPAMKFIGLTLATVAASIRHPVHPVEEYHIQQDPDHFLSRHREALRVLATHVVGTLETIRENPSCVQDAADALGFGDVRFEGDHEYVYRRFWRIIDGQRHLGVGRDRCPLDIGGIFSFGEYLRTNPRRIFAIFSVGEYLRTNPKYR